MTIKNLVKRAIGEKHTGRVEYWKRPRGGPAAKPFNGQAVRARIFFDLLHHCRIGTIVETGTFRGTTTALFAATSLPVYTTEVNPRFFAYARTRLRGLRDDLHMYRGDSRSFLREIASDSDVPRRNVFFYLDAHWHDDLPLREEMEIIFSHWIDPVIMVDDFAVPGTDYGFDDYGSGKRLDFSYIEPVVTQRGLSVFFPNAPAAEETGARRGCVVVCTADAARDGVDSVSTLRRALSL